MTNSRLARTASLKQTESDLHWTQYALGRVSCQRGVSRAHAEFGHPAYILVSLGVLIISVGIGNWWARRKSSPPLLT